MKNVAEIQEIVKNSFARVTVGALLVMSGNAAFAAGEFTDRIQSARTVDTKQLRENVKQGADNFAAMISLIVMVVGFAIFIWGLLWVGKASRSEGRTNATPGWVMVGIGGALGAAGGLYLLFVGVFNGAAS